MISRQEWPQVGMALVHASGFTVNGKPLVSLTAVLDILRTHAESGCGYRLEPSGVIHLDIAAPTPEPRGEEPKP